MLLKNMSLNRVEHYFKQVNIFLVVVLQSVAICKGLEAHISLNVEGEGFHRYLKYQVNFDNSIDGCYIALHLNLPPSLYTNVNELNDLRRLGVEDNFHLSSNSLIYGRLPYNSTACFLGETDTELFAFKAMSQNVTICSPLIGTNSTLKLPVHQRYHYASENNNYATITLPKPTLLLGCKERIKQYRTCKIDICSPCVELVPKWREIPYIMDTEDVIWTIPVGNSALLTIVTCTTLVVTILSTIFLMRTIWKSTVRMDKKRQ